MALTARSRVRRLSSRAPESRSAPSGELKGFMGHARNHWKHLGTRILSRAAYHAPHLKITHAAREREPRRCHLIPPRVGQRHRGSQATTHGAFSLTLKAVTLARARAISARRLVTQRVSGLCNVVSRAFLGAPTAYRSVLPSTSHAKEVQRRHLMCLNRRWRLVLALDARVTAGHFGDSDSDA